MIYRSISNMKMKNNKIYLIISIISFAIVLVALLAIGILLYSYKQANDEYERLAAEARSAAATTAPVETALPSEPEETAATETQPEETEIPTMPLADIPVNFDYLKSQNEDIIGWITVDGTEIDYPILYDQTYNQYYLNHSYTGTATSSGSIFVLGENASDFTDFVTVVYGHNVLNGSMFAPLHKFRDAEFFDSHGEIVVYTPDRKLTYQVFAAYVNDDLDIVANNDFSTEELRQQYIDSIYTHTSMAQFKPEYPVTPSDQIITLSTCVGIRYHRYVAQGVLVSDEAGVYVKTQD